MSAPALLRKWGFVNAKGQHVIKDFQRAFAFWDLDITGVLDVPTRRAIQHVVDRGERLSRRVRIAEVRSKGDGTLKISRALLRRYEALCTKAYGGRKIPIISGYRDPKHNAAVGGVSNSQHVYGRALDIADVVTLKAARKVLPEGGMGYNQSSGCVAHLDIGPTRTWRYGR